MRRACSTRRTLAGVKAQRASYFQFANLSTARRRRVLAACARASSPIMSQLAGPERAVGEHGEGCLAIPGQAPAAPWARPAVSLALSPPLCEWGESCPNGPWREHR